MWYCSGRPGLGLMLRDLEAEGGDIRDTIERLCLPQLFPLFPFSRMRGIISLVPGLLATVLLSWTVDALHWKPDKMPTKVLVFLKKADNLTTDEFST